MREQQPDTVEYLLTPEEFEATRRKLERVNERAEKRGFTGRFDLNAVRDIIESTSDAGLPVERVVYRCTVAGEPPAYGGWQILARLDMLENPNGEPLWVVNTAPGIEHSHVDRSTLRPGHCGHCQTTRWNRRKLMLVRHQETGEIKQVGSSCLKDFLGWNGTPVWIDPDRFEKDVDLVGSTMTWEQQFTPRTVLMAAIATIATYGWSPASYGEGIPTRERVSILLHGTTAKGDEEKIEGISAHVEAAEQQVDADLTEAIALTSQEESDYGRNLHAGLTAGAISRRTFALVCSAVSYLAKARQPAAEKEKLETFDAEWLGEVGEKITVEGEVTTCMVVDGFMPNSTQVLGIITTDTGIVKIVTSAQWAYDDAFHRGAQVCLTGTVKAHTDYNRQKQTVLTRPKLAG